MNDKVWVQLMRHLSVRNHMLECCSGMILSPRLYKEGFWNRIVSVLSCRGQVRLGEQKGDIFPIASGVLSTMNKKTHC